MVIYWLTWCHTELSCLEEFYWHVVYVSLSRLQFRSITQKYLNNVHRCTYTIHLHACICKDTSSHTNKCLCTHTHMSGKKACECNKLGNLHANTNMVLHAESVCTRCRPTIDYARTLVTTGPASSYWNKLDVVHVCLQICNMVYFQLGLKLYSVMWLKFCMVLAFPRNTEKPQNLLNPW